MNLTFALNMILLGLWMPLNLSNSVLGYICSTIVIIGICVTDLKMMVIAGRNKLGWREMFIVRLTFSLYSGWITAATILNVDFMLKSLGMWAKETKPYNDVAEDWLNFMMFMSEEAYAIIVLWVAFVIYEVASWKDKNPVFGLVFSWAGAAILSYELKERERDYQPALVDNLIIIEIVHSCSMVVLIVYLILFRNVKTLE